MPPIVPSLWFDTEAESAAEHYKSIFPNSRIVSISRYGEAGKDITGQTPGKVMTVDFELDGKRFTALNGGPMFKFSEATSFQVMCKSQEEVDHYWERLGEDGTGNQCGWLKDRFGLSWQIIPTRLAELMSSGDSARKERVMGAMLQMTKIDIAALERAAGES